MQRPTLHLFGNQLAKEEKTLEVLTEELKPGDSILEKRKQLDMADHIQKWLSSPGLRAPR
jgi:hypothetical protein